MLSLVWIYGIAPLSSWSNSICNLGMSMMRNRKREQCWRCPCMDKLAGPMSHTGKHLSSTLFVENLHFPQILPLRLGGQSPFKLQFRPHAAWPWISFGIQVKALDLSHLYIYIYITFIFVHLNQDWRNMIKLHLLWRCETNLKSCNFATLPDLLCTMKNSHIVVTPPTLLFGKTKKPEDTWF